MNMNPGYEYELALGLAISLCYDLDPEPIHAKIRGRTNAERIVQMARGLQRLIPRLPLLLDFGRPCAISDVTQNDSVGPADLLLTFGAGRHLGVSVKCSTLVSRNPSGRIFLTEPMVSGLKKTLAEQYIPRYVSEMTLKFGARHEGMSADPWHRKRAQTTTDFIQLVISAVVDSWQNILCRQQKLAIAKDLSHARSPLQFRTVMIRQNPLRLELVDESRQRTQLQDVDSIEMRATSKPSQYVCFHHGGSAVPLAKVQVKFNDGIYRLKGGAQIVGDPFGSWNFEFVPVAEVSVED